MNRMNLYNTFPFEIDHAKGIRVYGRDGREYLDTFSGIGVLALGHCNPEINLAIKSKLDKYSHISNFFGDGDSEKLAGVLLEKTGRNGSVFFTNSGTESVEAVYKAIKKSMKNANRKRILTFKNGFHGRTLGALSLNGFEYLKHDFMPLFEGIDTIDFNDSCQLENYFSNYGEDVAAVFIEAVQGSGGVVPATEEFMNKLNEFHLQYGFFLVADEIQAGIGRTGKFYSYQNYAVQPDMITLGKAIGGGLPLGASLFLGETARIFSPGDHGSTFAPNPVSAAGGLQLVRTVGDLTDEIEKKGEFLEKLIENSDIKPIRQIRRKGLMLGLEFLTEDMGDFRNHSLDYGLLLNIVRKNTVRLLPALNITMSEIEELVGKLEKSATNYKF